MSDEEANNNQPRRFDKKKWKKFSQEYREKILPEIRKNDILKLQSAKKFVGSAM